jgi:hypothetical protein
LPRWIQLEGLFVFIVPIIVFFVLVIPIVILILVLVLIFVFVFVLVFVFAVFVVLVIFEQLLVLIVIDGIVVDGIGGIKTKGDPSSMSSVTKKRASVLLLVVLDGDRIALLDPKVLAGRGVPNPLGRVDADKSALPTRDRSTRFT